MCEPKVATVEGVGSGDGNEAYQLGGGRGREQMSGELLGRNDVSLVDGGSGEGTGGAMDTTSEGG